MSFGSIFAAFSSRKIPFSISPFFRKDSPSQTRIRSSLPTLTIRLQLYLFYFALRYSLGIDLFSLQECVDNVINEFQSLCDRGLMIIPTACLKFKSFELFECNFCLVQSSHCEMQNGLTAERVQMWQKRMNNVVHISATSRGMRQGSFLCFSSSSSVIFDLPLSRNSYPDSVSLAAGSNAVLLLLVPTSTWLCFRGLTFPKLEGRVTTMVTNRKNNARMGRTIMIRPISQLSRLLL